MNDSRPVKLNIFLTTLFIVSFMLIFTTGAYAVSVPSATGKINSSDGAVLRQSASIFSDKLAVLADNTKITIHKEVFKSKTNTKAVKKWYYVTANGKKGYIRSDLVDSISYGYVKGKVTASVNYRSGPGIKMDKIGSYSKGAGITVVMKANPVSSTRGTSSVWYKIKAGKKYYYVCSSKVKLTGKAVKPAGLTPGSYQTYIDMPVTGMTDKEFESYLTKQGFPESYKTKLRVLHKSHPNWGFVAYKTDIDWPAALAKQTKGGTSLVSGAYGSRYRSGTKQYEKGWYKANSTVVSYYMDPRNFLNESGIYMFEDLSYKPSYQKTSVVNAILSPTSLPGCGFTAKLFVDAGSANNISPVFLASRARQETGGGSDAISGTKVLGKKVYNPFNIGAYGSNPLYNGLVYAYGKGWTTQKKAVNGGAFELAKNYILKGQFTTYYQRFNVRNGASKVGTHQYMTNIMAPYSEARSTKNSYSKYSITDKPLIFEIPVYKSMPSKTKLP